ncbi:DNA-directed RNA polymerase [Coemansia sp. RSA 1199]|nr:DNA-directed RNA polymerase [Coemansia sp. RSA 1199]
MSQLAFKVAQSSIRLLRPSARIVTRAAVGSGRLQNGSLQTTRFLSQRAKLQSLQLAEAPKPEFNYYEENMLLVSPSNNFLPLHDYRKDTEQLHYMHTGKTVTEQLSVMQSCLFNGNTEQAQRILVGMYQLYPQAMQEVVDVAIHNEILSGLFRAKPRPLVSEALQWYDVMENQYAIEPNSNTFAVLIGGFVNNGMQNVALALMQEMLRNGYTIHGMLLSSYLSDEDIRKIENMAKDVVNKGEDNVELASMLLGEVKSAEDNISAITGESAEQESVEHAPVTLDELAGINNKTSAYERQQLNSTNVAGIMQLKSTLESLYLNELHGYNLQVRLENDTYDAALARYREINEKRNDPLLSANTSALRRLSASWLPKLESMIEEEQQRCRVAMEGHSDKDRLKYGRYFVQLDASKMATVTILETLRLNATSNGLHSQSERQNLLNQKASGGVFASTLVSKLSKAIHNEIRFEQMKKRTNRHVFGHRLSLARLATSGKLFNMAVRRAKMREHREHSADLFLDEWGLDTRIRIGSLLVSMLLESARIPEKRDGEAEHMVPAFHHKLEFLNGRRHGLVYPSSTLRELFKSDSSSHSVTARHLPMLVPPRPWMTYNSGGYLTRDEPCMRINDGSEQLRLLKHASNEDRLSTVLAGLDALGMTRWAINRPVFEAIRKVWNAGREIAEIPASSYNEPEPVKPADYDDNPKARIKHHLETREWMNGRANQHSQRCDCNYKIEIAQAFMNHPMYFPHNMDFRGRAYPIPPHFNHLGNDMCRGLLTFHEGRPLTERGMHWLKIHLANLFGKDKMSHDERIAFVEENKAKIMAAADDPIPAAFLNDEPGAVRPWWLDAESPWQALAACIEYTEAVRSPDPAAYISHLHIHQDGTCNGLQHYAAMGRDSKGAHEVNLAMSDRPQDVYSGILRVAERYVNEDAELGVEEALQLKNRLTRKIVKQTVMTNVYGVTLMGAKEQIIARLREVKDENGVHVFDIMNLSKLALYLAKKIFASLGEMFTHAQETQNWLNESARRISSSMTRAALADTIKMAADARKSSARLRSAVKQAKAAGETLDCDEVLELWPDLGPGAMRRKRLDTLADKPMTPVAWTTPLGMTVLQPYRKMVTRRVATNLQNINVHDVNMPAQINSQKQKTAFPPNFVHSLDASHMVLSAIECKVAGLVFASVHDSYWTHACDVDKMNSILREQFVKMHKQPIMANVKAEFEQRYSDHMVPIVVWDYVNSFSFEKNGELKGSQKRLSKSGHEKQAEQIEADLARKHIESSDEAEGVLGGTDDLVQMQIEVNDQKLAESMEVVDLTTIELIDPAQDLFGAARQADLIAYTLSVNGNRIKDERRALMKTYRERVSQLRKYMTQAAKKTAPSKEDKIKLCAADQAAVDSEEVTHGTLLKYIEKIKAERDKLIDGLDEKYPVKFDRSIAISISQRDDKEQLEQLETLIKQGKLAGRLVKGHKFTELTFDDLPAQGDFDIEQVLRSPYFFS